MYRQTKRAAYFILILAIARIAIPAGGYILGDAYTPRWYETILAIAGSLALIGLTTALVGNGAVPHWVPRYSALLAGLVFFTVAVYVIIDPALSIFVSQWGLALSDIGLGVAGLYLWRALIVDKKREREAGRNVQV